MSSIFTKIIDGEIPSVKVHEDDVCLVIMDVFPSVMGQTLVIPKQEVDYLFNLEEETYNHLWATAKKVAKASDEAFATLRTCCVVEGFEVPHAHIKLYPVTNTDVSFADQLTSNAKAEISDLEAQATKIKANL